MGQFCCAHCEVQQYQVELLDEDVPAPFEDRWQDDDVASHALAAELLSPEDVVKRQADLVMEAVELLSVSEDDATLLLRSKAWNLDVLSQDYFADAGRLWLAAGLGGEAEAEPSAALDMCLICFAEVPMKLLLCGHDCYCKDCWQQYVKTAVKEGAACLALRCPTQKCPARLRPNDFRQLCPPELFKSYERFEREGFVNSCTDLAWCPGPRCNRVAKLPSMVEATPVNCPCGTQWCSGCKADMHAPVSCEVVKRWMQLHKTADAQWISLNTKPCPKCERPIEKNGGCMHMTCTCPTGCGHEFCWICLADWSVHSGATGGYYACNRYKVEDNGDEARQKAERYFHFSDRFFSHEKAQHYASTKQLDEIRVISDKILAGFGQVTAKQIEILEDAVKRIADSRRFLKWTYAHAAVSEDAASHSQELFEFHQAQLEGTLERLSDLMENTAWPLYAKPTFSHARPFLEVRSQIMNLMDVNREAFASLSQSVLKRPTALKGP